MHLLPTLLVVLSLAAPSMPSADPPPAAVRNPRLATLPVAIRSLVAIESFRVAEPWRHEWRADRPEVREGWIVVLEADPALVRPRQTEQAVLMAGAMTLEVVHVAVDSGTVVAILPREGDAAGLASGADSIPGSVPFHLATPALPESLDVAAAEARAAAATAAGIGPRRAEELARARSAGGDPIEVRDREALDRRIGALMRRLLPAESARADELEGRNDPEPRPVPPATPGN